MSIRLYVGNDHTLEIVGLKNGVTGGYVNGATVQATLKDGGGVNVSGQSWPVTLNYVTASNGNYSAILQDTLKVIAGKYYRLIMDASGAGLTAHWSIHIKATQRRN